VSAPAAAPWPVLRLAEWEDTRDTLHLWMQVVGKVRLALEPMVNHWWQVPLYLSARGFTTSLVHAGTTGIELELDVLAHRLRIATTAGEHREVALEPRSVASFHAATMAALEELGVPVAIRPVPTEVPVAIPFPEDEVHRSYDPDAAQRYWRVLLQAHRLLWQFRARYLGKVSPVHLFWGGNDLAVTRFSGRTAPRHPGGVPNCPDWVQELAYSHELHSCGFWPGGSEEGSFYAYAYPEPPGFADWPVQPEAARYDRDLGEFVLPYEAVRTAADPDAMVLAFCQSTYEAVAELARWDRSSLEVVPAPVR